MAIVETVLGAVLQVVFDRLGSREVMNFFQCTKFDKSLVDKLKILMLAVKKFLVDAEDKQLTDQVVKLWLDELKHWFYRAEEVVNEIATEALRSSLKSLPESESFKTKVHNLVPGFSRTTSFEMYVTDEIRQVINMLESMLSQKDALGLREHFVVASTVPLTHRIPTTCLLEDFQVFGRDEDRDKMLEHLQSDESRRNGVDVITIVGMGGLGKTTLAKLIYNDSRVEKNFDLRLWVCVSDQFDVYRVTKSILESVTGQPYCGSPELNFLQVELRTKLRKKQFLLVLDDVWNEDYQSWESLRAPFSVGANGSKIIVTTRSGDVASIMRTAPVFHLKPLSDEDGWSLFSRHVFESEASGSDSNLNIFGKKIVRKCQGMPLAIKTLAGLLKYKQEIGEWEEILHSRLWDLPSDKSHILPALMLSFYHLPAHLKRCFSFCALFPKNHKIDRKQLVLLWMAENFVLLPTNDQRRIEDLGDEYVRQLLSRSLLEQVDASLVTMHDLVHDLADAVSGDLLVRHELDHVSKFSIKARHFSYLADEYDGITKFQAIHEARYLRTFITLSNSQLLDTNKYYVSKSISRELVPQLHCLLVLSLSNYENLLLPESIGSLKQLRYLDFSQTKIKRIPESVSTLHNLQTLILSSCYHLVSLPRDLWRLALLRHLDLTRTASLLQMPIKMGNLRNLQTLTDFVVGKGSGSTLQEFGKLLDVRGKVTLRRLQNITVSEDACRAHLGSRKLLRELALEFDIEDNDDSESARKILEYLKPHDKIERLTIRNYVGLRFPNWLDSGCQKYLINVTCLCLSDCRYCDSLPPFGLLPSLQELEIEGMDCVENVGPEFHGHNSAVNNPFPALLSLSFRKMNGWKVWTNIEADGNGICYPCLQKLSLHECPKLQGHLPIHMSLLKELEISECQQLSGLLPRVPTINPSEVAAFSRANITSTFDLTSVTILRLVRLEQMVQVPPEICRLSSLRDLIILDCQNLTSLANVRLPPVLQILRIVGCENLELLPEGLMSLTHLQNIRLEDCPCLRRVHGNNLPISLNSLYIDLCERLEFPIPMENMVEYTSLERLYLKDTCRNLVSFPLGKFPNLRYMGLWECKDLENVYIPEPDQKDSQSMALLLRYLYIGFCPKLKMIGNATATGEAAILPTPNLVVLHISRCENVKPILTQTQVEVLFPKLQHLRIENMDKKPISLLRFSHLVELVIWNYSGKYFPDDAQVSLPGHLKKLNIRNFPKLRNLNGKALQSLTCLRNLHIFKCPLLQRLPQERLPHSLGCLEISQCPLLQKRCRPTKGQDWFKISHLPCILIDGDCITDP